MKAKRSNAHIVNTKHRKKDLLKHTKNPSMNNENQMI